MEANASNMERIQQDSLGKWYPDGGVPRNVLETEDTPELSKLWNIRNVFKGTDDDMCKKLLDTVCAHSDDYRDGTNLNKCRVALVGPSGCGKTFVLR